MDEDASVGTRLHRLVFTDDSLAGLEPQLKGSTIKTITHPHCLLHLLMTVRQDLNHS